MKILFNTNLRWRYEQSTGIVRLVRGEDVGPIIGSGYSGAIGHHNSTQSEGLVSLGPIPRGLWTVGTGFHHKRLGPQAIPLYPRETKTALGRSGFYIHGDNRRSDGSASTGCIILHRRLRDMISASQILTLEVV